MSNRFLTRRNVLSGFAATSIAAVSGLTLSTARGRAFTQTSTLETATTADLRLEWREIYNGRLLESTNGTASEAPDGPVISLGNILPADTGSLSVRLQISPEGDDSESDLAIAPTLTLTPTTEFSSPGLQEYIQSAIWYDTGTFDVEAFGAENSDRDPGEQLVHPEANGSLGTVLTALESGVTLDASPGRPGSDCLTSENSVTITFGWSFPPDQPNINAVQGDSVGFDIQFAAVACQT